MKIRIINTSENPLPHYETIASAGMDLRAKVSQPSTLKPLERAIIKTGLFIELPIGYEAQVRPRSGLAAKYGIFLPNSPGTIDADYRGEVCVILGNVGSGSFIVTRGMRIAQMVVSTVVKAEVEQVNQLDETTRGRGGFGHTGV